MLPKDLIYHFVPVATDRCCPLSLTGYLSKHLIVFIKKNIKRQKHQTKIHVFLVDFFFFSEKVCCFFIFSFSAVDSDLSGKKSSIPGNLK